jgi:phage N-6-adenine-methyltransferase
MNLGTVAVTVVADTRRTGWRGVLRDGTRTVWRCSCGVPHARADLADACARETLAQRQSGFYPTEAYDMNDWLPVPTTDDDRQAFVEQLQSLPMSSDQALDQLSNQRSMIMQAEDYATIRMLQGAAESIKEMWRANKEVRSQYERTFLTGEWRIGQALIKEEEVLGKATGTRGDFAGRDASGRHLKLQPEGRNEVTIAEKLGNRMYASRVRTIAPLSIEALESTIKEAQRGDKEASLTGLVKILRMEESTMRRLDTLTTPRLEDGYNYHIGDCRVMLRSTVHSIEKVTETAAALDRWEDLKKAIDFLIECQQVILMWWDDHVLEPHRPSLQTTELLQQSATDTYSATKAGRLIGHDKFRISRWKAAHKDLESFEKNIEDAARSNADLTAAANHRAKGTGQNEWHTPEEYLSAARWVLGTIDLDPASSEVAQHHVCAETYYTKAEDGLSKPWAGSVWLNPPYSQPLISQFTERLVAEYTAGNVPQTIMLTHNYTDTAWFHGAEKAATLICFTRGRINFLDEEGEEYKPTQGQAFFYYATDRRSSVMCSLAWGFVR